MDLTFNCYLKPDDELEDDIYIKAYSVFPHRLY